ncbi:hypothetical protein [Saccharothrix australiensis]|uniref:Uncharacterized protein n=1 Tax=Saccharothrix australiensis TaxID=2072 RepID=A0A495W889_9PSEU|nr:hypothetical protein [Saccharothrix australiensis]RKT57896.1 hypothetical protein C8E97_6628 [Saccharothrix australiensis]
MSEPDPFASPFHHVRLPGQTSAPTPPGYAGHPGLPMPAVDPRALPPPRPLALTTASWSWLAGAVLVVFGLPALFFAGGDAFADELYNGSRDDPEPLTRTEAEFGARFTPVLFGLGFAVLAVPFVLAALKLRSGRDWARVLLAALGVPALLFGLFMLISFTSGVAPYVPSPVGLAWVALFLVSVVAGFVAMFLPASNHHVRAVRSR